MLGLRSRPANVFADEGDGDEPIEKLALAMLRVLYWSLSIPVFPVDFGVALYTRD
jgi:hypothetical protein